MNPRGLSCFTTHGLREDLDFLVNHSSDPRFELSAKEVGYVPPETGLTDVAARPLQRAPTTFQRDTQTLKAVDDGLERVDAMSSALGNARTEPTDPITASPVPPISDRKVDACDDHFAIATQFLEPSLTDQQSSH